MGGRLAGGNKLVRWEVMCCVNAPGKLNSLGKEERGLGGVARMAPQVSQSLTKHKPSAVSMWRLG